MAASGYIDVTTSSRNLNVVRIANTETGTMDLEFQIDEGQKVLHREKLKFAAIPRRRTR